MNTHVNQQLRVASFFSGIGGFDLAFEQTGYKVVFQCEKDSFCGKKDFKQVLETLNN